MTVYAKTDGQRDVAALSLADGNEYDLITVETAATGTLESVIACNTSNGTRKFSMTYERSGSSYSVVFEESIDAGKFFHLKDHNLPIPSTAIVRVQSDAAGLDVTAVYVLNHSGSRG
jgi:hypothetical protein